MSQLYNTVNGDPDNTKEKIDNTAIGTDVNNENSNRIICDNNNPINLITVNTSGDKSAITVYGNDLKNKNPSKLGKVYSFIFLRNEPLIIIGPQCKF